MYGKSKNGAAKGVKNGYMGDGEPTGEKAKAKPTGMTTLDGRPSGSTYGIASGGSAGKKGCATSPQGVNVVTRPGPV